MNNPQAHDLAELLNTFYTARSSSAWSGKAKVGNLKYFSQAVNFLTEHRLFTLEDLEARISSYSGEVEAAKASMKVKSARKKELEDLLRCADLHRELKSVYDELSGIKWKSKREKFKAEHANELRQFHMARRKLERHRTLDSKIPVQTWRRELALLQQEYQTEYERYKPLRDDMIMLLRVKDCVDTVLRQQEQAQEKRRETER